MDDSDFALIYILSDQQQVLDPFKHFAILQ